MVMNSASKLRSNIAQLVLGLRGVAQYLLLTDSKDIEYLTEMPHLNGYVLLVNVDTEECYALQPLRSSISLDCSKSVRYSYLPVASNTTYIISENFESALLSFIKGFVEPGATIALRLNNINASLYTALTQLWKLVDISKELNMFRAYKPIHLLQLTENAALKAFNIVKRAEMCKDLECVMMAFVRAAIQEAELDYSSCYMRREDDLIILRIVTVERGLMRGAACTTISFENSSIAQYKHRLEMALTSAVKGLVLDMPCASLIERLEKVLDTYGIRDTYIEICGLGTAFCEYPTTSDIMSEDCLLKSGLTLYVEIGGFVERKRVVIGRTLIVKEEGITVVGEG